MCPSNCLFVICVGLDQLCRGPSKYRISASKECGDECTAQLELTFEGQAFKVCCLILILMYW